MGGAFRQIGIVAAAALYALDHHVERLADDHEKRARAGGRARRAWLRGDPARDELRSSSARLTASWTECPRHGVELSGTPRRPRARRDAPGRWTARAWKPTLDAARALTSRPAVAKVCYSCKKGRRSGITAAIPWWNQAARFNRNLQKVRILSGTPPAEYVAPVLKAARSLKAVSARPQAAAAEV